MVKYEESTIRHGKIKGYKIQIVVKLLSCDTEQFKDCWY